MNNNNSSNNNDTGRNATTKTTRETPREGLQDLSAISVASRIPLGNAARSTVSQMLLNLLNYQGTKEEMAMQTK